MKNKKQRNSTGTIQMPSKLEKNFGPWRNRVLLAVPSTGLLRMEWVLARYSQIIPTNWSQVELIQWMTQYVPVQYLLPDAENLIAKEVVQGDYEWLIMIEEDNIIPQNTFVKFNQYMHSMETPVVSGLYFTKSNPTEPVLYRGRGTSFYSDWKMGDKVWVDGIPFGCILIHGDIIRKLWDESPEYEVNGQLTRRVFDQPNVNWGDPGLNSFGALRGTTDLAWCTRVMNDKIFEKAGWPEYQKKEFPFLVDTNIAVDHIDQNGRIFPPGGCKKFLETYARD
jgi:hypothetical protein